MKKLKIISSLILCFSIQAYAGGVEDDPLLIKVMGEAEIRQADGANPIAWNIDAWIGKDLNKLWIKSEIEIVDGETEESELQLLYSKAIDPFWDIQYGVKKDFKPAPSRTWGVVALKGVAPYLFEVDASIFVGGSGRTAVRLDVEYEYMFSQKLILSPELEMNIFGKDDEATGTGKGLANIGAGLRLRYELNREFSPYIGFNWGKKYGNTAKFASNEGEDIEDAQLVTGARFWF